MGCWRKGLRRWNEGAERLATACVREAGQRKKSEE
jgi:hypothetical protein